MGCASKKGPGRWHFAEDERGSRRSRRWGRRRHESSGNRAFDEYREETLRRLEDEQNEFTDFLERLRHARDKAEFDQFMEERARNARDVEASDGEAEAGNRDTRPQT